MSDRTILLLNERPYSKESVVNGQFEAQTHFEKTTLEFCHEWYKGKQQFEIQTSGSTGTPKKITFTRQQLEASALLTQQALQLQQGFNSLICLDTRYIAGQMMLVRSIITGMNMIAIEPTANPFTAIDDMSIIDFVALVPYQVQAILSSADRDRLNSTKRIIIGGAAIGNDLINELQNFDCIAYATYGMTETISHIALQQLNGAGKQEFFYPLPSVALEKDERNCLVITAPHASPDKLVTNDIVDLREDQSFKILGRYDNVVNTGGVKISPELVEEKIYPVFQKLQFSNRFFISSLPDNALGNRIVLIIEGNAFNDEQLSLLANELKARLDRFENPKEILFINTFVETATQKISRSKTMELLKR